LSVGVVHRARRLYIPQLVIILPHIFLSHFGVPLKSSNRSGCFFFETLGAQDIVNRDVFGASEAKNHGIYDVLCHWEQIPRYLPGF
jgi:hypothetical protein